MEKLKQKLSSRKLWAAVVGVIVGLAAAFGIGENEYAQVAGIVTSAVSVCSYIFSEGNVDASREKYGIDVGEILREADKLEKQESAAADEDPAANS